MEKVLMKWLTKLEYMLADTMPYKNEEPDVFETQSEDLNEIRELIKWCNGKSDSAMGKYTNITIQLAKCDDGSLIWNTGDGILINIEENSAYSEFHKYFSRALAESDSTMGKYLQVSDAVIMKRVFAYARWLDEYGWKVDSEDGFWFRECEDELTPDISVEYADEMVWAMFKK
jgi:hypothetical protein